MQSNPNPIDQLIRHLIDTGRPTKPGEVQLIIDHVANAPFDPGVRRVGTEYRGLAYGGRILGSNENSLFLHLAIRVVADQQWATDTTASDYLEDLQQAVRDPSARLAVYKRRGGNMASVIAPNTVPASRLGPEALPFIYVIYYADRGIVISGYQVSSVDKVSLPGSERWLK